MNNKILLSFILCMFVLQFVSAAPPVLSTIQVGSLEILTPGWDNVKQGQDVDFYWHVFNTTQLITNATANCTFHLYSIAQKGEHIYTESPVRTFEFGRDFEVSLSGSNFTNVGEYCHIIECNTTSQSGALERCFQVTKTGTLATVQDVNYLIWATFLIFALAVILLFVAFTINNKGVRLFLMAVSGLLVLTCMGIGLLYAEDYLIAYSHFTSVYESVFVLFLIMGATAIIGLLVWFIYFVFTTFAKIKIGNTDMDMDDTSR